jgi:hypothetical protein
MHEPFYRGVAWCTSYVLRVSWGGKNIQAKSKTSAHLSRSRCVLTCLIGTFQKLNCVFNPSHPALIYTLHPSAPPFLDLHPSRDDDTLTVDASWSLPSIEQVVQAQLNNCASLSFLEHLMAEEWEEVEEIMAAEEAAAAASAAEVRDRGGEGHARRVTVSVGSVYVHARI